MRDAGGAGHAAHVEIELRVCAPMLAALSKLMRQTRANGACAPHRLRSRRRILRYRCRSSGSIESFCRAIGQNRRQQHDEGRAESRPSPSDHGHMRDIDRIARPAERALGHETRGRAMRQDRRIQPRKGRARTRRHWPAPAPTMRPPRSGAPGKETRPSKAPPDQRVERRAGDERHDDQNGRPGGAGGRDVGVGRKGSWGLRNA